MRKVFRELAVMDGISVAAICGSYMAAAALPIRSILPLTALIFAWVSGAILARTDPPEERHPDTAVIVDLVGSGTEWTAITKR